MADEDGGTPNGSVPAGGATGPHYSGTLDGLRVGAIIVGVTAALAGLVDGIVQMSRSHVVGCPENYIPTGYDNNCYSYPDLGIGLFYVAVSIGLAVVVVLLGIAVHYLTPQRDH